MTIIPRALVNHQLRCDVQDCHACGWDHVGMIFRRLPKPYGQWTMYSECTMPQTTEPIFVPVLMRESEAGPFREDKDE